MSSANRLLTLFLILALFLSACQPIQPRMDQPSAATSDTVGIHLNMASSPLTLDPSLTGDIYSSMLIEQMFLGLTNVNNETNEIEPELAESWQVSADGTVWTFHLRKDAKWSDGHPVTAQDVAYGVKRTVMPETGSPTAYVLYLIKNAKAINQTIVPTDTYDIDTLGIQALDAYTLQITLESAAPYFLSITSLPAMRAMPSWAIEQFGDGWSDPANIVVNGPYKIAQWQKGQGLRFVKNPSYFHAAAVQIEQVDITLVSDPKLEFDLYRQGKLDVAGEFAPLPIELLKEVRQDPILSQELHEGSMANTLYVGFTLTKPPFDNPLVRKAFSAAIDREKLAKEIIGTGIPATQITPRGIFGAPDPEVGIQYDPAQAKQWLAEAGYPNGKGFPVVKYYAFEGNGGAALQQMWEEVLNVQLEFKAMVFADLYPTVAPDAPIETMPELWQFGWVADYPDANNFVVDALHCRNSPNFSRASCTQADRLAEQAAIEADPTKRIALYKQIETLLFEDEVRVAPYHHNGTTILTKPYLKRAYPTFAYVNWDRWQMLSTETTNRAEAPTANAQIVRYGSAQGMDNIDPAIGENFSVNNALISLYDALFIVRGDKRENNLVERYEVAPDASTFTFKLKQNAKFHDGSPVNAAAVVYSWQRMLRLQGPPTYRWTGVADQNSISQVDAFTVKFTLKHPFAPFLDTLAHFYIVNPAIVEANKGDDDGQSYLKTHEAGSGPFTQGQWEDKKLYEFIAVPDYWGGWKSAEHIDGFQWILVLDPATQMNGVQDGIYHISEYVDIALVYPTPTNANWHVEDDLSFSINSIKLNTQSKYLSDLNLRKALAYALNYAELPKLTNPPVTIAAGPMPLNFPGANQALELPRYDLEKAKAYLQQSQWPDGGMTLDYVYVPAAINEEITGKLLRDALKQLNITLNMIPSEWDVMTESCTSPEKGYDLISIYTIPAYLDPDAHLYNQYHSSQWGSYNACSFYKNEAVDQLLDEARSIADPAKRQALYDQANRLITADQPSIWTFTDVQFVVANNCIQNFHSSKPDNVIVLFQDLTMEGCP